MKIKQTLKNIFTLLTRQRVASSLLQLSDTQLKDIGISRVLLSQGAKAYPWRVESWQERAEVISIQRKESQSTTSFNHVVEKLAA